MHVNPSTPFRNGESDRIVLHTATQCVRLSVGGDCKIMVTPMLRSAKRENIHFRVSPDAKELIEKAVVASGQSLTDFATRSLLDSATEVLEREYITTLSNRDRDRLLAMLDADDEPNAGLYEAAEIHRQLISE